MLAKRSYDCHDDLLRTVELLLQEEYKEREKKHECVRTRKSQIKREKERDKRERERQSKNGGKIRIKGSNISKLTRKKWGPDDAFAEWEYDWRQRKHSHFISLLSIIFIIVYKSLRSPTKHKRVGTHACIKEHKRTTM